MISPKFSILIPTRDRPATFRHSLATVIDQQGDDYEIVVADNSGSPATKMIVDEFSLTFPNIKYIRSDIVLPMAENWEKGLDACSGEYITILGDDDGFLPSSLDIARKIINAMMPDIIAWSPHTYWWPDTIVYWNANKLILSYMEGMGWINSTEMLRAFYDDKAGFGELPSIYSAFVKKECIEKAITKSGRYLYPTNLPPDITSGILNLLFTDRYFYTQRPLSIRGNSGKSIGTAHWARGFGDKRRETYFKEEGETLEGITHPDLIPSPNLHITIANCMLHMKEHFFPDSIDLTVNLENVVSRILNDLNNHPESYEADFVDAHALAEKIGMKINPTAVPRKKVIERSRFHGPIKNGNQITGVAIDCNLAGIFNIKEASCLVDSMLPHIKSINKLN